MRVERLPYTDEDLARNEVRFRITACGWCGGDPHDADDCPVARDYASQIAHEAEQRRADAREDG